MRLLLWLSHPRLRVPQRFGVAFRSLEAAALRQMPRQLEADATGGVGVAACGVFGHQAVVVEIFLHLAVPFERVLAEEAGTEVPPPV